MFRSFNHMFSFSHVQMGIACSNVKICMQYIATYPCWVAVLLYFWLYSAIFFQVGFVLQEIGERTQWVQFRRDLDRACPPWRKLGNQCRVKSSTGDKWCSLDSTRKGTKIQERNKNSHEVNLENISKKMVIFEINWIYKWRIHINHISYIALQKKKMRSNIYRILSSPFLPQQFCAINRSNFHVGTDNGS
jgi:hypothetical protein